MEKESLPDIQALGFFSYFPSIPLETKE